ncbi:hypothetical protein T01_5622 [Trichinella spiralis]|uniref:Uncharacterized protein n=1 Tax=Trichinella spiralis TaxID=6334 RepID=A0A0V1AHM1_TRISP|nr:hypothetical protein T01_5622 [Trichinella spiralis]
MNRKMLDNCSLFLNLFLIPYIAENPISYKRQILHLNPGIYLHM